MPLPTPRNATYNKRKQADSAAFYHGGLNGGLDQIRKGEKIESSRMTHGREHQTESEIYRFKYICRHKYIFFSIDTFPDKSSFPRTHFYSVLFRTPALFTPYHCCFPLLFSSSCPFAP